MRPRATLNRIRRRMDAMGLRQVRRVVVFVLGTSVLLIGLLLLVLPGPAIVVIPAGLAILGLEFRWARRWLRKARTMLRRGVNGVSGKTRPPIGANPAPPPQA